MKLRYALALAASAVCIAGIAGTAAAAQSGPASHQSASGGGVATARSVNLRALARGAQLPVHGSSVGPLGINGLAGAAASPAVHPPQGPLGRPGQPWARTEQHPECPAALAGQPASHPARPDCSYT